MEDNNDNNLPEQIPSSSSASATSAESVESTVVESSNITNNIDIDIDIDTDTNTSTNTDDNIETMETNTMEDIKQNLLSDLVKWEGNFVSNRFPKSVYGNIEVRMPKDIVNFHDIITEKLMLHYKGLYKPNSRVAVELEAAFRQSDSNSNTINNIGIELTTKGYYANRLHFIVKNYNNEEMNGIYKSFMPPDEGTFHLEPSRVQEIDYNESSCIIV